MKRLWRVFSFNLNDEFVEQYKNKPVKFGFPDASDFNSLGEITFLRSYSRKKEDGTKETWAETCRRITEGSFTLQKNYIQNNILDWNYGKAQRAAQDSYDRMFQMKWTPPGRGLAMMGSAQVMELNEGSALNNCGAISTYEMTKENPAAPFLWLMTASTLGIGVGFDQLGAKKKLKIYAPDAENPILFVVPDTREGWVEAYKHCLESYLKPNKQFVEFDYSLVRPAGAPIVTFGGVASGPDPLKLLLESVKELLTGRDGEVIGTTDIADLGNMIGKCIAQGGVRRSAQMLMGDLEDPEFLGLKDYTSETGQRRSDWSHLSNNSINAHVGQDLSSIVPGIIANGEPGVLWMDVVRKFGRLKDPADNKDARVVTFNPCLVGSAKLLTTQGWITFGDAFKSGQQNNLIVDSRVQYVPSADGQEHPSNWKIDWFPGERGVQQQASEVFLTQKDAKVIKVATQEGYEVTLTPDHLIATKDRGMVAAEDLVMGEKILLTAGPLPVKGIVGRDPETIEEIEAALMGLIAGDGTFGQGKLNDRVIIDLWGTDKDSFDRICSWIDVLWDAYGSTMVCESNRGYTKFCVSHQPTRDKISISSTFLGVLLNDKYGFNRETKHTVPVIVMENARNNVGLYYIAALAFADGTVNKYNKVNSSSARINQSNKPLLQDVQKILLANGISSTIYLRREATPSLMPDGKGGQKMYNRKANYELLMMAHKFEYGQLVGFLGSHKDEWAKQYLNTKSRKRAPFVARVLAIEDAGREDVYCLREPNRRILCADGITMRRCAEQPLESGELCTLTDIYLENHDSLEDFKKTIKVAYLYAKTVTLVPSRWPKTNAIMQRNRRIGLSLSGVANFVDHKGLPELRRWLDAGYEEVRRLDRIYSEWLCVRESIRVTTIKPGGTTGILTGNSPGAHFSPGGAFYMRTIRFGATDPMLPLFRAASYRIEDDVTDKSGATKVVYFPIHSKSKRSERDVSIFEKANLAATLQELWSDNAVSVTLSFDPATEGKHIGSILTMFEGKLKTVSFLPMLEEGAYPQMPYGNLTEEEYNEYTLQLLPIDFSDIYAGLGQQAIEEKFCQTDTCLVKEFILNHEESEVSK